MYIPIDVSTDTFDNIYLGMPHMADLLYRVINSYILMLYTAYSPPQAEFVAVMGWDRDLVIPLISVAYLGFQKGAKFLLVTSDHTKGETIFSNLFPM